MPSFTIKIADPDSGHMAYREIDAPSRWHAQKSVLESGLLLAEKAEARPVYEPPTPKPRTWVADLTREDRRVLSRVIARGVFLGMLWWLVFWILVGIGLGVLVVVFDVLSYLVDGMIDA